MFFWKKEKTDKKEKEKQKTFCSLEKRKTNLVSIYLRKWKTNKNGKSKKLFENRNNKQNYTSQKNPIHFKRFVIRHFQKFEKKRTKHS